MLVVSGALAVSVTTMTDVTASVRWSVTLPISQPPNSAPGAISTDTATILTSYENWGKRRTCGSG
jgi:hypothetical protein